MTSAPPPYRPPAWLPGGHLQTLYAALLAPRPHVEWRRERCATPDGDFIDLDWLDGPAGAPLVVLFHGLEGGSDSHYARALMREAAAAGWRGVVAHFRGCSGEPNRLPRAYHSGDSAEIDWILRRLKAGCPAPLFAAGVSLGGNALLKWLGETGGAARALVAAAAALSVPLDLPAAADSLDRGLNRIIYVRHFLKSLVPKAAAKLEQAGRAADARRLRRAGTLRAFDEQFTAPAHGFKGADDYWRRSASRTYLSGIAVPTLVVNARNDPFLPARHLPRPDEAAPCVTLEYTAGGGHAGFVSGPFPGHLAWPARRFLAHFRAAPEAADGQSAAPAP